MELTGKAKIDFNKWLYEVYFKEYFQYQMVWQLMGEPAQNAIVIYWFESIGFSIGWTGTHYWMENSKYYQDNDLDGYDSENDLSDYQECIKKACEIYNLKHQ